MNTWALGSAAAVAVALAACGSASSGPIATAGTGGATAHTMSTGTGASSGSMGTGGSVSGSCTSPVTIDDCTSCATQKLCLHCAGSVDSAGVNHFNDLFSCIFCRACYTTCDGATENCTAAPITVDACDVGTPGMTTCDACQNCSATSTCSTEFTACMGDAQCNDLLTNLGGVCTQSM
jgi:hypothetical protein